MSHDEQILNEFGSKLAVTNIKRIPSGHYEADIDVNKELYEQIREHIQADKSDDGDEAVNLFLEQCVAVALQNAAKLVGEKKK